MTKQFVTYLIVLAVVCVGTVAHGFVTGRWTASAAQDYKLPEIPLKFGEWSGEDTKSDLDDPRLRNLSRSYTHTRSGRQFSVSLTVGPAGLNAQHTPEYCYPGSGFALVGQPQNLTPSGRSDSFRSAVYRKQLGGATESIRIAWAWTNGGAWAAPKYPELSYFGRAPLYKLYVVTDVTDGDPNADAQLQMFVADLLNNLRIGS